MACFLVPAAEAVVTTIIAGRIRAQEKKRKTQQASGGDGNALERLQADPLSADAADVRQSGGMRQQAVRYSADAGDSMHSGGMLRRHISRLNIMLWSGSGLLFFDHIINGEVVPYFPFLTAAADPAAMLQEMATAGTAMALVMTLAWLVTVAAVEAAHSLSHDRFPKKV